ncbi:hypothetical protein BLNAU_17326 [Blattamonas nauphoetae]|uniref:Uncharacterized protein n=1 Tax=Blattamonas nauphoetae TaxID=2049346 RepID=A0ABQ9XBT3_9EUKA|nr:hypothetical protein BLNAU_17326 [Blattamonas nauphoetae]
MTSIAAILTRNEKSNTGIGGNLFGRYFGGSLATLAASSMVVSDCTLHLDGTTSPFILKSSSCNTAPSTVELVHTKIVASDAVMGPVSEIESSDTPCQFDIVVFSTDLNSICVIDGNSLSFRHSANSNADSKSLSAISSSLMSNSFTNVSSSSNHHSLETSALSQRCVGSTITKSVGALQGTIVSDFNLGGSLLCSNTTFAKCTSTAIVKRDVILHKEFNVFFSNYYKSFRPEFRFDDTHFSGQKQLKFWSHNQYIYRLPSGPFTFFTTSVSQVTYSNCSFSELVRDPNAEYSQGGLAICVQTPAPVTITSCTFSDLFDEVMGAAICIDSENSSMMATVHIESSSFTRCRSSSMGGAIFYQSPELVSIVSSSFIENSCPIYGGACHTCNCDYSFCRFEGNSVESAESGGAICEVGDGSIWFCHFRNTFGGKDWFYWGNSGTIFGCTRSEDWTEGSEVVVMGSGEGEECSASQPCNTLTEGLKKASMNGKNMIHVGSGWTGSTTIEQSDGSPTLRGFYPLEESSRNIHTPTSSFSITVGQDSSFTLDSLSLTPADGLPLLKCESSGGDVQVRNVQTTNISGISAPLFEFSSGSLTMENSRFENLSQITTTLISLSGSADVSLESVLFRTIDTSSCLIIVSSGGTLSIGYCLFHTITRTAGEGAAAIDMTDCNTIEISSSTFSHCHSVKGQAGALTFTQSQYFSHSVTAFFVNNRGKTDADAHDIHFTGFDPEALPWSYPSQISSFSDFPQVATDDDRTGTIPVFSTFATIDEERIALRSLFYQPALFTKDLIFVDLGQSLLQQSTIDLYLNTKSEDPIVMKPVHLLSSKLTIQAPSLSFIPHIQQSSESQGSFFVAEGKSNLTLIYLYFIVTSAETEPLIKVESQSAVRIDQCVMTSDGCVLHRSIVESCGNLQVWDSMLFDFTFESHSCFECTAGEFDFSASSYKETSCASNVTTSGDGAVLNADNCYVSLSYSHYFACHARNGGALFCHACSSLSANSQIFVGCSATQNGGAISASSFLPYTSMSVGSCFINCSAEFGGAVFINSSEVHFLQFYYPWGASVLGRTIFLPLFLDCSASKGAGAYFDGDWSIMDRCDLKSLFMSNGGLPSTGQDLFFSESVAESLSGFEQIIQDLKDTSFSMSTRSTSDTGLFKHVEVEGESIASFNLERPKFILTSRFSSDYCRFGLETMCSSIRPLLTFFHAINEDGEIIQVPIILDSGVSFYETGVIRSQSILFTSETISDTPAPVKLVNGPTFWKDDSFFVRVEKDGTAELPSISFTWEADVGFCEVADESGRMVITSSTFDVKIDLTRSLVVCSVGTLVITESTFTSTDSLFSNTATESLKIEMDTVTFLDLTMDESVDGVVHFEGADALHLKKVGFENVLCGSINAVRISVIGSDLERVAEYVPESGFPARGIGFDGLYKALDLSEPPSSAYRAPTLLLYYHQIASETIFVSSDGRDGFWCLEVEC